MKRTKQKPPVTFRPDSDVEAILARVRQDGKIVSFVVNRALRGLLTSEGYARKRELAK